MRYLLVAIDETRAPALEESIKAFVTQNGGYITSRDVDAKESHLRNFGEDFVGCSQRGIALLPLKNL